MKHDKEILATFIFCLFITLFNGWGIFRAWSLYLEPDYYREVSLGSTIWVCAFLMLGLIAGIFGMYCCNREMR